MATPWSIAEASASGGGPFVGSNELRKRLEERSGIPAEQIGQKRDSLEGQIDAERYMNPWAATQPSIDQTQNYYGNSADMTRAIERVAAPGSLDPNAFTLPGFEQLQSFQRGAYGQALGMQNLAAQQVAQGQGNVAQSRRLALNALTAQGPSAAESQLFQGQEAAARNALAMARSGRGFGSAGQLRGAIAQGQQGMQLANQQAATLRAQEEANRRQQLLALGAQDIGALGQTYGQQLGAGQLGLSATGQAGQLSLMQQQALADQAKTNAAMQFDANKLNAQFANYREQPPQDQTWTDVANATGAIGGGLAGLGMLFSDRDSKTDIRPTELADKFAALGSHSYRYKNTSIPGTAPGRHSGPMADELRALGVTLRDGATGWEKVDAGRLALANASATGELARRLKALEAA